MHTEEEGACNELNDGRSQMGVIFIVYVQHKLGQDLFLVFGGGVK